MLRLGWVEVVVVVVVVSLIHFKSTWQWRSAGGSALPTFSNVEGAKEGVSDLQQMA